MSPRDPAEKATTDIMRESIGSKDVFSSSSAAIGNVHVLVFNSASTPIINGIPWHSIVKVKYVLTQVDPSHCHNTATLKLSTCRHTRAHQGPVASLRSREKDKIRFRDNATHMFIHGGPPQQFNHDSVIPWLSTTLWNSIPPFVVSHQRCQVHLAFHPPKTMASLPLLSPPSSEFGQRMKQYTPRGTHWQIPAYRVGRGGGAHKGLFKLKISPY